MFLVLAAQRRRTFYAPLAKYIEHLAGANIGIGDVIAIFFAPYKAAVIILCYALARGLP